jgi:hypothetical protein
MRPGLMPGLTSENRGIPSAPLATEAQTESVEAMLPEPWIAGRNLTAFGILAASSRSRSPWRSGVSDISFGTNASDAS